MKTITKAEERMNLSDGKLFHLVDEKEISHARLFARVVLNHDDEVKPHEHHGEYELYYILSGEGIYTDNGTETRVGAGCVTYCKNGGMHGIKPVGDEKLEFIALVIEE